MAEPVPWYWFLERGIMRYCSSNLKCDWKIFLSFHANKENEINSAYEINTILLFKLWLKVWEVWDSFIKFDLEFKPILVLASDEMIFRQ